MSASIGSKLMSNLRLASPGRCFRTKAHRSRKCHTGAAVIRPRNSDRAWGNKCGCFWKGRLGGFLTVRLRGWRGFGCMSTRNQTWHLAERRKRSGGKRRGGRFEGRRCWGVCDTSGVRCSLYGHWPTVFFDVGWITWWSHVGLVHLRWETGTGDWHADLRKDCLWRTSVFSCATDFLSRVSGPDPRPLQRGVVWVHTVLRVRSNICSFKTFQVQVILTFWGCPTSAPCITLDCFRVLPS